MFRKCFTLLAAALLPSVLAAQSRFSVSVFGGVAEPQTVIESRFSTRGSVVQGELDKTAASMGVALGYNAGHVLNSPLKLALRVEVNRFTGAEQSPFAFDSRKLKPYELVIQDGDQELALSSSAVSVLATLGYESGRVTFYAGGGPSVGRSRLYHSLFASASRFTRTEPFNSFETSWGLQVVAGTAVKLDNRFSVFAEGRQSRHDKEFSLSVSEVQNIKLTGSRTNHLVAGVTFSP